LSAPGIFLRISPLVERSNAPPVAKAWTPASVLPRAVPRTALPEKR